MRRRIAPTLGGHPAPPLARTPPAQVAPQQHPSRVRLPGLVEVGPGGERNPRYRLHDLSLGGFCFETTASGFHSGERLRGSLELCVDGISITLYFAFEVRTREPGTGRVGCRFENLGPQESAVLRHLVSARLTHRPVQADVLMQALARG